MVLKYLFGGVALMGSCKMARDMLGLNKKKVETKVTKVIENGAVAVFDCKPVEKEWNGWLERAFACA